LARRKAKLPKDRRHHFITKAMGLAERDGWRHITMADIAREADMPLIDALILFPDKASVLAGLTREIDEAVLQDVATDGDAGDSVKDKLFDVLMRRFDALEPYKKGLASVVRDLPGNPVAVLCLTLHLHRSMALMLEAAALSSNGIGGHLRASGLGLIYANAMRVWFRDTSADMATTMAAVDRGLSLADRIS